MEKQQRRYKKIANSQNRVMAFHEFCSCLTENEIISFFSSLHLIFERQQAFLASHIYDGRRRR